MKRNSLRIVFIGIAILLMGITGLSLPSTGSSAETATIDVSVSTDTVGGGETFTVDIMVTPNNSIAGAQFDLSFDSSLVTVDSVEEGNLLSRDGASTYFNSGNTDNQAGSITGVAGAIITPGETVSTAGTLATITMTAKTSDGTSAFVLSNVVIGSAQGQSIQSTINNGEITVNFNQPPVLNSIGDKSVNEGDQIQFTVSAIDADEDDLIYSVSGLPSNAGFDANTRTFTWTPNFSAAGNYPNITFQVSDGTDTDSENITITVNHPYEDWDVNHDNNVNVLDLIMVGQCWDQSDTAGWIAEDVNEDGLINVLDMIPIGQHWTS
ncbi:MAG: hypothetical protein HQ553_03295 [Chloroflexi bacterium]|nr:hypothetical protein [Chloroflexota bacterium]